MIRGQSSVGVYKNKREDVDKIRNKRKTSGWLQGRSDTGLSAFIDHRSLPSPS